MIQGIFETHLHAADLERSAVFYENVLGLEVGTSDEKRRFVFGWMPAVSIYLRDPDGHMLEFNSMLDGEAKPDLGVVSLEDWEAAR